MSKKDKLALKNARLGEKNLQPQAKVSKSEKEEVKCRMTEFRTNPPKLVSQLRGYTNCPEGICDLRWHPLSQIS